MPDEVAGGSPLESTLLIEEYNATLDLAGEEIKQMRESLSSLLLKAESRDLTELDQEQWPCAKIDADIDAAFARIPELCARIDKECSEVVELTAAIRVHVSEMRSVAFWGLKDAEFNYLCGEIEKRSAVLRWEQYGVNEKRCTVINSACLEIRSAYEKLKKLRQMSGTKSQIIQLFSTMRVMIWQHLHNKKCPQRPPSEWAKGQLSRAWKGAVTIFREADLLLEVILNEPDEYWRNELLMRLLIGYGQTFFSQMLDLAGLLLAAMEGEIDIPDGWDYALEDSLIAKYAKKSLGLC